MTLSPVRLKVVWERLSAAADEAGTALRRSAFSNVIRESRDFSYSLFDANGNVLAQSTESIPSFLGTMPRTMRHFLERFPLEHWNPGDVAMTNDPWLGTGHLPDLCLARPLFDGSDLIGFAGAVGHLSDIGGSGLSASAKELFHEGLIIPPMWGYRNDVPLPMISELIPANVRVPGEVLGDIEALVVGCRVLERRVLKILEDPDSPALTDVAAGLYDRSEAAMRRAIANLPIDTPLAYTTSMDGDERPLPIRVRLYKEADELHLDFEGSAPQVDYGINAVLSYTRAYALYALKCVLGPDIPNNEGTFAPITVSAPEGTIVNPTPPAPVGGRNMTGHFVAQAVLGALAVAIPEAVLAESGAPRPVLAVRGRRANGERFSTVLFLMGGMGAGAEHDGLNVTAFPTNTSFTPVEIIEQTTPLRVVRKELRPDSGGEGTYRGGLGQVIELQLAGHYVASVTIIANRANNPARGIEGGGPGACCRVLLNGREVGLRDSATLEPFDRIVIETPGGGGYGPSSKRPNTLRERDRLYGYVTGGRPDGGA